MVNGKVIETDVDTSGLLKCNVLEFMGINCKSKGNFNYHKGYAAQNLEPSLSE